MKKNIRFILIAAIFIAAAGILTGIYLYTLRHKNLDRVKPDFVVTATDLIKEFENNEASASLKYTGKVLEITGIIKEISEGENNSSNIKLLSGSEFSSVICTFPDKKAVEGLESGSEITIRGECAGYLLDFLMNNCVLVSQKQVTETTH